MNIRIAICGYGNLGRGVERALQAAGDMEPVAIVTRRPPKTIHPASAISFPMRRSIHSATGWTC